ncbi:filamentous haemagglutinin family protein [Pseudomonas sp. PP3]|uniref:filamentous haemagglutinin family protein n=1 Tax=Pseudomonas sp. PP3 TaxID=2815936 RepID=UPI001BAFF1E7|nr:filamentous haemagglutinin family protein [Pseudomonas sp. PP3]
MLVRQARRNTHSLSVRRDAARSVDPALWLLKPLAQAIALCLVAGSAEAATAFSSTWFAAKGAAQQAAAARPAGGLPGMTPPLAQQQRARQQLERSVQTLNNTVAAIAAQQAAQAAGRAAAFATVKFVPDGLGEGGLKVDTGLTQGWQNAKGPQQTQADGKTTVRIEQTADKAILNWETFNVGRDTTVEFAQQSNWAALNRVNDPSARASQIQGQIKGDGTVMLVNRNGIVFSGTSQVNVRNLVAAATNISDAQFRDRGLYYDSTGSQPTFTDAAGKVLVERGARIETHKPTLSTDSGGYVLLLGNEVENAGTISTAKGQTVLGAGDRFYIRKGSGTEGNGFSTTFGNEVVPGFKAGGSGKVSNTGLIQASTGDITLTGHEVVQNGVLLASTSVNTRGTLHLLNPATDTSGSVTLGQGSVNAIMLDSSDLTALDSQHDAALTGVTLNNRIRSDQSRIDIGSGGTVEFQDGSITLATGGQVAVAAGQRSLVRNGALIDVSGALGVKVAMENNNIKINVQGNEQRDSSVNREGGALNSNDVWVDVRELIFVPAGTNGYATDRWYTAGGLLEVGGYLGTQGHSIGEWMAQGGTVSFTGNDVVTEKGSVINLSGGTLDVQSGFIRQSWLRGADGRLYEISRAPGDILYTGLYKGYEDHSERWGQTSYFFNPLIAPSRRAESGYTVGRDAGQLVIATNNAVLDGQLVGEVFQGERQIQAPRAGLDGYDQAQTARARRAQLIVGSYEPSWSATTNGLVYQHLGVLDQVQIGGERPADGNDLGLSGAVSDTRKGKLFLDTDRVNGFRLGALKVAARDKVEVNENLTVDTGGDISLFGQDVQVKADLAARAGSLNLGTGLAVASLPPSRVTVDQGVHLDTRGVWANLRNDPTDVTRLAWLNGGVVSIRSTGDITLASGSVIDVSSGGAVLANGKTRGGKGGDVTLESSAERVPDQSQLVMDGDVRGYGVTGGGTLKIQANKVLIGAADGPVADHTLQLAADTFNKGFSAYNVIGLTTLQVAKDAVVDVSMPVYRFADSAADQPGGVDPLNALELWTPTLFQEDPVKGVLTQRAGASLALQAGTSQINQTDPANSTLTIGQGSRISVDPGQRINLRSAGQITVDGELNAWGGTIDIRQQQYAAADASQLADPKAHARSIWIGDHAVLDVAGRANTAVDAQGRAYGQVGKGGSIIIGGEIDAKAATATSADAFVIVRPGARLEASGAEAVLDIPGTGQTRVARDGGRITLSSYSGLFIEGDLHAAAGGSGAAGGRLEIVLDTPAYRGDQIGNDVRLPREMIIGQGPAGELLPAELQPGESAGALRYGDARLSADKLMSGSFDSLSLFSNGFITFDGDVDLHMNQSLSLYAGSLSLAESSKDAARINLAASYMRLSGPGFYDEQVGIRPRVMNNPTDRVAAAQFSASADLLDLGNNLSFGTAGVIKQLSGPDMPVSRRSFDRVTLDSRGDMRFLGKPDLQAGSSLWTAGDLHLRAAQIYPGTRVWSEVRFGYQGQGSMDLDRTLTISSNGSVPAALPYSVFGRLAFTGGNIEQGGVVRAPLGLISLGSDFYGSTRAVNVLPGSVTSVSGAGLVMPYGGTTDGTDYRYNGQSVIVQGIANEMTGVVLMGQYVNAQAGSLIDLSGGGDLRGVGFVSGRGGSTDTRLNPLVRNAADGTFSLPGLATNPVYAIVPGNQSTYAPMLGEAGASDPRIGQQITIGAGVPGLAAGTYTLLPSTFALLPGAFRVEVNGQATASAGSGALKMRNGSWTSAGQMSIANTGLRDSLASQVILTSADVLRRYSQYNETSYNQFVQSDAARRSVPRGQTSLDGKSLTLWLKPSERDIALDFDGKALFAAAEGGVLGTAVVKGSTTIEILGAGASSTQGFDGISLHADDLNKLGAGRLTLGATPYVQYDMGGNFIQFRGDAKRITLREGAMLSAPEVALWTSGIAEGITVEAGAGINTLGRGNVAYDSTAGFIYQPGKASLLMVSNGWTNTLAPEAPSGTEGAGSIRIGTCPDRGCINPSLLYSNGSISAATDNQFELGEAVRFGTRHLTLAVGAVNAGSAEALAAAGSRLPAGLALNQNVLDRLLRGDTQFGAPALETLSLTTRDSFNFIGSVTLDTLDPQTGKSRLENLVLVTPAIYGLGGSNDVATIRTKNLIWNGATQNPGAVVNGGAGTGHGTLDVQAQRIEFGYGPNPQPNGLDQNNRLALGFANVNLNASERITANHKGSLAVYEQQGAYDPVKGYAYSGGNLNLRTPLLTGEGGSVNLLKAGNTLTLTSPTTDRTAIADALGAQLNLEARNVVLDGRIALASGKLAVKAEDDLTLTSGAYLDVAGRTLPFNDVKKYSWGGDVALYSSNGNIRQAAGSRIDLSAVNNQAGNLSAVALAAGAGMVDLQGEILGSSSGYYDAGGTWVPYKAGGVDIRAQHLGGSGELNGEFAALNQRLNAGQVSGSRSFQLKQGNLVIGDGLKAGEVNVSVDNGSLTVVGLIDASGERVGSIRLSGTNGLTVAGSAVLDAHGRMLRLDSYGKIIDAPNRAMVELNSGDGMLTLASGARIDLRHGTDVDVGSLPGQHDGQLRGTLELNAPRMGTGDIAIDASGALNIQGARSIGLNATRRYIDAADGTDPAASGRPYQVIDQAYLDGIHVDSNAFINAALANTDLLQRKLAGLNNAAYADAFHLRPGVEIASKTADGDLVVQGDLDLSGYRYASLNPHTRKTSVYGSGESGSLVIRAGGNLDIYGSINDGFAPPPETVDDTGWKLVSGVQPFGGDLIVPGAGVTLADGTQYPIGATLNYDLPIQAATLASGTLLPTQGVLAETYTFSAGTVLAGAVHDAAGNLLYAAGTLLGADVTLPAGSLLGAGTRLNKTTAMQGMLWPKGVPLPGTFFDNATAGVKLNGSLALLRGSLIPSMTDVKLADGTTYIDLRPLSGTQQGRNWAVASMLPSGSASWSMRVVAGADLGAADNRAVKPVTTEGNLRLADTHYGLKVIETAAKLVWGVDNVYGFAPYEPVPDEYLIICEIDATACAPMARWTWAPGNYMGFPDYSPVSVDDMFWCVDIDPSLCLESKPGTAVNAHTQMFSVLRTGTGDLDLMAAGNLSMDSPFGVYTAGTQSSHIDPRYNQPRGRISDDGSVLGSTGSDYEKWVDGGSDSLYQAWFPQMGGNLTINAGGSVSGDVVGRNTTTLGMTREQVPSVAVGNWLWRQGTGNNDVPTAWWINFGSYASQPFLASDKDPAPFLVGFTGFGTLGGGNISLRTGGDGGMLRPMGDGFTRNQYPRSQGLIVAVGSTGRVGSDGSVQLTGGGDIDIRVGGTLNPSLAARAGTSGYGTPQHDLQGALINLRGDAQLTASAAGGVKLQYGYFSGFQDQRETRGYDPFTATTSSASGGLVLIPGDSGMRLNTRGDLVLGGAADPGRVVLQNSTPFTTPDGVVHAGGGLTGFSLWTDHTAIDLFSAGGNLTPSTLMAENTNNTTIPGGSNTSPTDNRFVVPSILRAVAGQGSIYVGSSAGYYGGGSNFPGMSYSLLLAPSNTGQLELLAGDSIYAGGYSINQSGASPLSITTPFAPAFNGYTYSGTRIINLMSNSGADGMVAEDNKRHPLFAFGPDSYSGLAGTQGPARFYALTGDLVGVRTGETLNFGLSQRTWYEAAGPVWMSAGRDIVASGTTLGQPVQVFGNAMGNGSITATGNLFIHNNANDVSRVSAGRDIIYSSFDIAGPGTLEITAGRNIQMEDRASITSIGPVRAGDNRPGASLVLQAGVGAEGLDYTRFIARYLDPKNLAVSGTPLAAQPGKVVKTYDEELRSWLTLGYGFNGNEEQARAFYAALPSAEQAVFARQVYFAELRAGGLEYADEGGPRQGSYLRGRNAIAALFPTTDVAGNTLRYDGDITLYGGAGVKTLFGGDIQMLTPGGGQVFGVEGAAPPSTSGVVTQGEGNIQLYSQGSILLGQSRVMTTFGGSILGWSAEGDINAGRGSKTTVVFTPPKRVYDTWGNVTLSPTVPSTGAGIATLNPIAEVPPGDIDLIAPLGTIDAGEAGIRVSGNINIIALRVVNAANIQVQGKSSGIPVTASVNTGAIISASSAATSATQAAEDMSRQQQAAARKNLPSIVTVQVLSLGNEPLTPSSDGASRAPTPGYNPDSPVQVLGAGALDERARGQLTEEERGNLTL